MQDTIGTTLVVSALTAAAVSVPSSFLRAQNVVAVKQMDTTQMMDVMSTWPAVSKEVLIFMMKKYGAPAAMSAEMAMWGRRGRASERSCTAWKSRTSSMHHTDVMQQGIDYTAPAAMYDALAIYDGGVVLERTTGEMSSRCDNHAASLFLAPNLAHEIVVGKQTVVIARRMYGAQITAMKAMRQAPYTETLMFGPLTKTNDPDQALTGRYGTGHATQARAAREAIARGEHHTCEGGESGSDSPRCA